MSVDERHRAELFELLVPTMGREATVKLVEALPPAGEPLATADQLHAFERRMDARFEASERRMDALFAASAQRTEALEQRMDTLFAASAQRTEALEQRMDLRSQALRDELTAVFRGELVAAVSGQTRHIIIAVATAVFGIGGLAVTLERLL